MQRKGFVTVEKGIIDCRMERAECVIICVRAVVGLRSISAANAGKMLDLARIKVLMMILVSASAIKDFIRIH